MGDVADRLKEAAEVLRTHARDATPGPWDFSDCEGELRIDAGSARTTWKTLDNGTRMGTPATSYIASDRIAEEEVDSWERGESTYDDQRRDDFAYNALTDPEVGAAFADWLADYANTLECFGDGDRHEGNTPALRVANAILASPRGREGLRCSDGERDHGRLAQTSASGLMMLFNEIAPD